MRDYGIGGFYKGVYFNVILCINPAIMNTVFDKLKAAYVAAKGGKNLTDVDAFLLGALSKSITTVITYPLIRLKTMFQAD